MNHGSCKEKEGECRMPHIQGKIDNLFLLCCESQVSVPSLWQGAGNNEKGKS